MRIIAGEFRGRKLLAPESDVTRPVTDRVKQSVFDILESRPADFTSVYDVFSGTGSFGLEAVSRGATRATFFDADRSALARLRKNLATLGVAGRCAVRAGDLFRPAATAGEPPATLIFFDPPYRLLRDRPGDLRTLADELATHHLADGGLIVFRHDAADALELPNLHEVDDRTFGGMRVRFLQRRNS